MKAKKKESNAKLEKNCKELNWKKSAKAEEAERAFQLEQNRIAEEKREEEKRKVREARLERERVKKAIYDKYINNSLRTGSTPYSRYFGSNSTCDYQGCSKIKVTTSNSDVYSNSQKKW